MTCLFIVVILIVFLLFRLSPRSKRSSTYSGTNSFYFTSFHKILLYHSSYFFSSKFFTAELESCMQSNLERYKSELKSMNAVVNEESVSDLNELKNLKNNQQEAKASDNELKLEENTGESLNKDEKYFLPYAGNGYIGLSVFSKRGLHSYHQKSLNLKLNYNPLVQIYSDTLTYKGKTVFYFHFISFCYLNRYSNSRDNKGNLVCL